MKKYVNKFLTILLLVTVAVGFCPLKGAVEATRTEELGSGTHSGGVPIVGSYIEYTANGRYMTFTCNIKNNLDGYQLYILGMADEINIEQGINDHYCVEYYDKGFNLISSRTIPIELPLFGAFYSDGSNYYVLSGQENKNESSDVECFRITKYDLSWNRLGSCGLYDCNTTEPFRYGSADIASSGNNLVIRTSRKMYSTSSGTYYNYQANLTIVIDKSSMTITDSITQTGSANNGYVSRSLNQFVETDDGHAICADLGDYAPRAISLFVSPEISEISRANWEYTEVFSIPGSISDDQLFVIGSNESLESGTCTELGGLAVSDTSYLVAGCSLYEDPEQLSSNNVFLAVKPKDSDEVTLKWLTDSDYSNSPGNPFIVKIDGNRFVVMWAGENGNLTYEFFDGQGNALTGVFSYSAGRLSGVEPIVADGKIIWYVTDDIDHIKDFYTISIDDGHFEAHEHGVKGFVERLYSMALGRPSDSDGKYNWMGVISSGQESGGAVAKGFLTSVEFNNRNLSNEVFVRTLYKTFFDREADDYGLNYWISALENGSSREQIIDGFINSTEWATLCWKYGIESGGAGVPETRIKPNDQVIGFATRLYTTCLCREPDPNGLNDWADQLANKDISGSAAAHGFFFSNEFIAGNYSNDEYVTRLYRTFMRREPDPAGFADWTGQLAAGATRESVFEGFAGSSEWAGICAEYGILK